MGVRCDIEEIKQADLAISYKNSDKQGEEMIQVDHLC